MADVTYAFKCAPDGTPIHSLTFPHDGAVTVKLMVYVWPGQLGVNLFRRDGAAMQAAMCLIPLDDYRQLVAEAAEEKEPMGRRFTVTTEDGLGTLIWATLPPNERHNETLVLLVDERWLVNDQYQGAMMTPAVLDALSRPDELHQASDGREPD